MLLLAVLLKVDPPSLLLLLLLLRCASVLLDYERIFVRVDVILLVVGLDSIHACRELS